VPLWWAMPSTSTRVGISTSVVVHGSVDLVTTVLLTTGGPGSSDPDAGHMLCRPHSVLSRPAQRPDRGSSGSVLGTVQGMHPMDR